MHHPDYQEAEKRVCEGCYDLKTARYQKSHKEQQEDPLFFVHEDTGKWHQKGHPDPQGKKYKPYLLFVQPDDILHKKADARLLGPEVGAEDKNHGHEEQDIRLSYVLVVVLETENHRRSIFCKER